MSPDGPKRQARKAPEKASTTVATGGVPAGASITLSGKKPNFLGTTLAQCRCFPPDSMGAIGPSQFVLFCNGRLKSFNRNGIADGVLDINPDDFFSSVMTPGAFSSDPRIRYDRMTGTWFLVMIDVPPGNTANRVMIALTKSPTITAQSIWEFYYFEPDSLYGGSIVPFAYFPTLGIDTNALYIGANFFDWYQGYINSAGYVISKSLLLDSQVLNVTQFPKLLNENNYVGPYTPQGVDNFNSESTFGYFVGVDGNSFGRLMLRKVINPGSATPTMSSNIPITVLSTAFPIEVPHLGNNNGSNGYLEAIDDRLSSSHIRDNNLYTSHNIGVDGSGVSSYSVKITRNGSRWYEINILNPDAPTLTQAATLYQSGYNNNYKQRFFWMPSVMTNGLSNLVLGCSTAGAKAYVDAAFANHFSSDAKGTIRAPLRYTNSTTAYNPPGNPGGYYGRRWGDYSHVSLDPNDNMTMWTTQEYCNATNSWGVKVLRILTPPPPVASSVLPLAVTKNTASATITIKAAPAGPRAFYDPGPDFPNRLTVQIAGVTVTSVSVVDTKTLQVEISTVGSSAGYKTITITNPDGQKSVSARRFRVKN